MVIKILLLAFVLLIALYFLKAANYARTQAWKKILFSLFVIFMIVATIFPGITNSIANVVGVGRGADLLLYTLVVVFIFVVINFYMKFKEYEHRINKLSRNIAITEAVNREKSSGNLIYKNNDKEKK